jgi:uncharacterized 2Fe-2S/4Fe-4S cluster protein (DUF4445 family)
MKQELKVTFEPSGRSVYVLAGTTLLETAARAGYIIETPCGGTGKCGKCLVRVTEGTCKVCDAEETVLSAEQIRQGYRLACQCTVADNLTVEIPEQSLFQTAQKILSESRQREGELHPAVSKKLVKVDQPSRSSILSDVEGLKKVIGALEIDLSVLRKLPSALRNGDYEVTVTVVDNTVIDVEPGNVETRCYGMAVDIGTTTLVGTLVDMIRGADLAVASRINPQTSFGDDVVSRIRKCREEPDGLHELQSSVVGAVNAITKELVEKADIEPGQICEAVFAGNTTMQQVLCGITPMSLGEIPFAPVFRESIQSTAFPLGLKINPAARVHLLPQLGGFVGGDTVAGILSCRLDEYEEPALLIDVGTNGEIVLANRGRLVATSVAAGPAFEGARITNGMRATSGAIEKVVLNDDVSINVIGNAAPSGICGTGLVDAAAELLRTGILENTGRIAGPDEVPENVPEALRRRIVENEGHYDFVLAWQNESATGQNVCLYQKDIRELQLANGAIRAGVNMLLKKEDVKVEELGEVLIAGAFGNYIRRGNAKRIGMIPDTSLEKIRFVGNTASFGAKRVLLSLTEREYARRILEVTEHLDLSLNPEFQMEFSEAMMFPAE